MTDHLRQFGVVEISRDDYRKRLAKALKVDARFQRDLTGSADSVVLQPTTHTS
jgi:leucyl/phenylalanyl-tRNA--protein transferase